MLHSLPGQHYQAARAVLGAALLWGAVASAAEPDAGARPSAPLRLIETADGVSVLSNKADDFPPAADATAPGARAELDASTNPAPEPLPRANATTPVPNPAARAPLPEADRAVDTEPTRWGVFLVGLVVAIGATLAVYFARMRGS